MGQTMKDAMAGIWHVVSWHFDPTVASEGKKTCSDTYRKIGVIWTAGSDRDYTTPWKLSLFIKHSMGRS